MKTTVLLPEDVAQEESLSCCWLNTSLQVCSGGSPPCCRKNTQGCDIIGHLYIIIGYSSNYLVIELEGTTPRI
jgi:hypothetical protein